MRSSISRIGPRSAPSRATHACVSPSTPRASASSDALSSSAGINMGGSGFGRREGRVGGVSFAQAVRKAAGALASRQAPAIPTTPAAAAAELRAQGGEGRAVGGRPVPQLGAARHAVAVLLRQRQYLSSCCCGGCCLEVLLFWLELCVCKI